MKPKRSYIWIGLPVIISAVWLFAFYIPIKAEINRKRGELNEVKQQSQKVDGELRGLMESRQKEEGVKASLREYRGEIPIYDNFSEFMHRVSASARGCGLALDKFSGTFKTLDMQSNAILAYPSFELALKGKYFNIGKFLEELSSSKAYRRIVKGQISCDEKEYPLIAGRFEIEFKAWKERTNVESK